MYETYNPGSVIGIWAQNRCGKWFRLWSGTPQIVAPKSRIFSPHLELCNFKTKMLRLEFNHSLLDYYTELDAVLLIGTTEMIVPKDQHDQSLGHLLKIIRGDTFNEDMYNLTPNYLTAYYDLDVLKRSLHQYCALYERYYEITIKITLHWIFFIHGAIIDYNIMLFTARM